MPLTCIAQQEVGIRRAAAAHHNSDALRQRRSAVGSGSAPPPCGNGGVTAPRIRNGYTDVAARISDGCTGTAANTFDRHVGTAVRGPNGFADSNDSGGFVGSVGSGAAAPSGPVRRADTLPTSRGELRDRIPVRIRSVLTDAAHCQPGPSFHVAVPSDAIRRRIVAPACIFRIQVPAAVRLPHGSRNSLRKSPRFRNRFHIPSGCPLPGSLRSTSCRLFPGPRPGSHPSFRPSFSPGFRPGFCPSFRPALHPGLRPGSLRSPHLSPFRCRRHLRPSRFEHLALPLPEQGQRLEQHLLIVARLDRPQHQHEIARQRIFAPHAFQLGAVGRILRHTHRERHHDLDPAGIDPQPVRKLLPRVTVDRNHPAGRTQHPPVQAQQHQPLAQRIEMRVAQEIEVVDRHDARYAAQQHRKGKSGPEAVVEVELLTALSVNDIFMFRGILGQKSGKVLGIGSDRCGRGVVESDFHKSK